MQASMGFLRGRKIGMKYVKKDGKGSLRQEIYKIILVIINFYECKVSSF